MSRQYDLDTALFAVIDVGQEAEVFQHLDVEILGLIDDEKHMPAHGKRLFEKCSECAKVPDRILTETAQPERIGHPWQDAAGVRMCRRNDSNGILTVALVEHLVQQGRLARPRLSRQHREDRAIQESVLEKIQSLLMLCTQKEELWVRQQRERFCP